jgi:hypothetical protein
LRARDRISGRTLAAKLFATLGAACLVASFAIASLLRPWVTLADFVAMLDHGMVQAWNRAEHSAAVTWLWLHVAMPLMARPAWLLPTGLGLVFVGAATTFAWAQQPARR